MIDREPEAGFIRQLLLECGGRAAAAAARTADGSPGERDTHDLVTQHDRWAQDFFGQPDRKAVPRPRPVGRRRGLDRRGNSPGCGSSTPLTAPPTTPYWGREYAISLGSVFPGQALVRGRAGCGSPWRLHESPRSPSAARAGRRCPARSALMWAFRRCKRSRTKGGDPWGLWRGFQRRAVSGLRLPGAVPPGPR